MQQYHTNQIAVSRRGVNAVNSSGIWGGGDIVSQFPLMFTLAPFKKKLGVFRTRSSTGAADARVVGEWERLHYPGS